MCIRDRLLDDFDKIRKEIKGHRKPSARLVDNKIVIDHAPESLEDYWIKNVQQKDLLHQVDALKNFSIPTQGIHVNSKSTLAGRIAHNNHHKLWVDSTVYNKTAMVQALLELDAFPIIMPCHSDVHEEKEIKEFWDWLKVFEKQGINILTQCSWGFELKEPIYRKDVDGFVQEKNYLISNHQPKAFFENLFELHQMSKQFKFIDHKTKIIFVRNRIPRALIRSKVIPQTSLITLGGGYYATGTDNLKRLLENVPKKLYYNDHRPSNWDWHDHIIEKV